MSINYNAHIYFFIVKKEKTIMNTKNELEKEIMCELEHAIVENGATMFLVQFMMMAETLDEQIKGFSESDMLHLKEIVDANVDYRHCLLTVLENNETDEWLLENDDFIKSAGDVVDGFIGIYKNELTRRGISVN